MLDEEQQIRFTQLWTDAQPTVSQYVTSLVRDHWVARDIIQNTSLTLLRKFSEYDDARPFFSWALGVAKFEILGQKRDFARNRIISDTELIEKYTEAWAEIAPTLNNEATALKHCVGELKGRSRAIIKLRYSDGKSSDSIGDELSISAANVRTILKRTRDALKRCVAKQLGLLGGTS